MRYDGYVDESGSPVTVIWPAYQDLGHGGWVRWRLVETSDDQGSADAQTEADDG